MTPAIRIYRVCVAFSFWHTILLQAGSGRMVGDSETIPSPCVSSPDVGDLLAA
jgi:hypothetical protein